MTTNGKTAARHRKTEIDGKWVSQTPSLSGVKQYFKKRFIFCAWYFLFPAFAITGTYGIVTILTIDRISVLIDAGNRLHD